MPKQRAISVITVAELRAGVLAAGDVETRDRRLTTLTAALALDGAPMPGLLPPAVALGVPLVTQDDELRDLPGVDVILV